MDRGATEVAASPAKGGDLPSFEELLATGGFQARLARARSEREKVLAAGGARPDDFILNTTRKPWEKDVPAEATEDRMVQSLTAAATMETGVVHPFPVPRRAVKTAEDLDAPLPAAIEAEVEAEAPHHPEVVADSLPAGTVTGPHAATVTESAPLAAEKRPELRPAANARRKWPLIAAGFVGGVVLGGAVTILPAYRTAAPERGTTLAAAVPLTPAAPLAAAPAGAAKPAAPLAIAPTGAPVVVVALPAAMPPAPQADSTQPAITLGNVSLVSAQRLAPKGAVATAADPAPEALSPVAPLGVPVAAPSTVPAMPGLSPTVAQPDVVAPLAGPDLAPAVAALSAPGADVPPEAQALPAGYTPAEDATAGAEPLPLGPDFGGQIVVHAPESVTDEAFAGVLDELRAAGYPLGEASRVGFTIKDDNVRFFHPEDAAAAATLASALGAEVRDFTSLSPAPAAGTLEVWLSGRGSAPSAPSGKKRVASGGQPSSESQQLQALRSRILKQLRSGEHF